MSNGLNQMSPSEMRGLSDYAQTFAHNTQPSSGGVGRAKGPANFPLSQKGLETPQQLMSNVLLELKKQNVARVPIMRAGTANTTGITLDWSQVGLMDRIMIRNKGAASVWIAFDTSGPSVAPYTCDLSFELQANESLAIPLCQFFKIGCRTAAGNGVVHAIAFQSVAGNQGFSIT